MARHISDHRQLSINDQLSCSLTLRRNFSRSEHDGSGAIGYLLVNGATDVSGKQECQRLTLNNYHSIINVFRPFRSLILRAVSESKVCCEIVRAYSQVRGGRLAEMRMTREAQIECQHCEVSRAVSEMLGGARRNRKQF